MVQALSIVNNNRTIFSDKYIIPLYQRDYAWEEKQIRQLIEDIDDVKEGDNYYIGSLIVSKKGEQFEVVDGQQRLTTLFMILNFLDITTAEKIKFACRERSNYTLERLNYIISNDTKNYESTLLQDNIVAGLKVIKNLLSKKNLDELTAFRQKLQHVVLYRIEVPVCTDLNHYFEIMNTRGEQLEHSDVLKARLMSKLEDSNQREMFACIWDACRDMSGYVQMHFPPQLRASLFGNDWNTCLFLENQSLNSFINSTSAEDGRDIKEIIAGAEPTNVQNEQVREGIQNRFESIIDFPYFLIHTLKVFVGHKGIQHQDPKGKLIDELMDDKKLTDIFERVLDNGVINGQPIQADQFAEDFVKCLLHTRFLFDKYLIKREYVGNQQDGVWSLKTLKKYDSKPAYILTRVVNKNEWYNDEKNRTILMLQSALRVSYTSPKVMHWITELLSWLLNYALNNNSKISEYNQIIEDQAKAPVRDYLNEDNKYMGVNTPHIVFNYLDFLLWRDYKEHKDYKDYNFTDFVFEFRNSVEHWYPQNPSEGSFQQWKERDLDSLGNLCLVHRHVNSRFSNMSPEAKLTTFPDLIEKGSLKLRIMSGIIKRSNSNKWRETECEAHGNDMAKILKAAVGIKTI